MKPRQTKTKPKAKPRRRKTRKKSKTKGKETLRKLYVSVARLNCKLLYEGGGEGKGGCIGYPHCKGQPGSGSAAAAEAEAAEKPEKTNFQKLFSSHNDKRPSFYFDIATDPPCLPLPLLSAALFLPPSSPPLL